MVQSSQPKANPTPKESTEDRKGKKARSCKGGGSGATDGDVLPPTSVFCADEGKTVANMAAVEDLKAY